MLALLLVTSVQNLYITQVKGLGFKVFLLDGVSTLEINVSKTLFQAR